MRNREDAGRLGAWLLAASLGAVPAAAQDGSIDLSRYVALGDSYTQGVTSGSIVVSGQLSSYPLQLYRQATGGDGFEQPLVSEPGIPGRLVLTGLFPAVIQPLPGVGDPVNLLLPRPYDNLGVAGSEAGELLNRRGGDVPHDLVLRGQGTALEQALALEPSFVTLLIGLNDFFEAVFSGLVIEGVTLTRVEEFERDLRTIVGALAGSGAPLAIANLGDATGLPFVTTVPAVVVNPVTAEPVLIDGRTVPLTGVFGDGTIGPLGPGDRVTLRAVSEGALARGDGIPPILGGSGEPLGDEFILDAAEIAAIRARIETFNGILRAVADEAGAAWVDLSAAFERVSAEGVLVGGIEYDLSLLGGIMSYDGIHPSPFGYGLIANEFITAINAFFGADIPLADLSPVVLGEAGNLGPPALGPPIGLPIQTGLAMSDRALANLRRLMGFRSVRRLKRIQRRLAEQPPDGEPGAAAPPAGEQDLAGRRLEGREPGARQPVERRPVERRRIERRPVGRR